MKVSRSVDSLERRDAAVRGNMFWKRDSPLGWRGLRAALPRGVASCFFAREASAREREKEGASSIRRVMLVSHELAEVFAEISIGFACKACSIDVASSEIKKKKKKNAKVALWLKSMQWNLNGNRRFVFVWMRRKNEVHVCRFSDFNILREPLASNILIYCSWKLGYSRNLKSGFVLSLSSAVCFSYFFNFPIFLKLWGRNLIIFYSCVK